MTIAGWPEFQLGWQYWNQITTDYIVFNLIHVTLSNLWSTLTRQYDTNPDKSKHVYLFLCWNMSTIQVLGPVIYGFELGHRWLQISDHMSVLGGQQAKWWLWQLYMLLWFYLLFLAIILQQVMSFEMDNEISWIVNSRGTSSVKIVESVWG